MKENKIEKQRMKAIKEYESTVKYIDAALMCLTIYGVAESIIEFYSNIFRRPIPMFEKVGNICQGDGIK